MACPASSGAITHKPQSQASPAGIPSWSGNARCDRLLSRGTARPTSGVGSFRRRARDARDLYVDSATYVVATWLLLPREKVTLMDPTLRRDALVYGLPLIVNSAGLLLV